MTVENNMCSNIPGESPEGAITDSCIYANSTPWYTASELWFIFKCNFSKSFYVPGGNTILKH